MTSPRHNRGAKYLWVAGLLGATVLGCVFYVERHQVIVPWGVHRYANAPTRDPRLEQWLIEWHPVSVPVLLQYLHDVDAQRCGRAGQLLRAILSERANPSNPAHVHVSLSVAGRVQEVYSSLSPAGRSQTIEIARTVLENHLDRWSPNVPTVLETAGAVLLDGLSDSDTTVQTAALLVLGEVWRWTGCDGAACTLVHEWKRRCYLSAAVLLASGDPAVRKSAAIALAPAPFHEAEARLVDLLDDPDPAVLKSTIVALDRAGFDDFTSVQKTRLVDLLNHPDPPIARSARKLLLDAGVSEVVVELARRMKDAVPAKRAEVVTLLESQSDVNPVPWLLELSKDSSPAVRIAVARAAKNSDNPDLKSKLSQMAESDPDPDVRMMCQQMLRLPTVHRR